MWFLPALFTEQWWDTDKHNAAVPKQKVPCTSAEMLSAVQGHFILKTAFVGEENSQIVGNCTVRNWWEAYLEHLQALVGFTNSVVYIYTCVASHSHTVPLKPEKIVNFFSLHLIVLFCSFKVFLHTSRVLVSVLIHEQNN